MSAGCSFWVLTIDNLSFVFLRILALFLGSLFAVALFFFSDSCLVIIQSIFGNCMTCFSIFQISSKFSSFWLVLFLPIANVEQCYFSSHIFDDWRGDVGLLLLNNVLTKSMWSDSTQYSQVFFKTDWNKFYKFYKFLAAWGSWSVGGFDSWCANRFAAV